MKAVRLLLLLAVLVGGLVIGSLNSQPVEVSLVFWTQKTTSGIAIIACSVLWREFWDLVSNFEEYRAQLVAVSLDPNAPPPFFN